MYFNPPTGKNSSNPFYHPLNEPKFIEEAVTVELDFKSDAEGKKAGGKMVRKGVYKMTFKNNAEMNKFMDTHSDKLNESTPAYRKMMKRYKGSDMEKVFKILDKEGYRMGEQSDTLVRNMLKKHKGNVKKAADQIMKDNPGMFDVNRMMMDDVQIDEMSARAHYNKMVAQGKVGRGGRLVTPIDRKRFPNREKEGLEGPFRSRKSGQVYYYDKKAGKYYDPLSDMYLQVKDVMETRVTDNLNDYVNLHETQINEEFGPETYESAKGSIEAILYMYKNPKFDPKVYFANNENGQLFVSLYDYNGDGLVDYDDLTLLLSLESAGLPFMYAFTYKKYMESDARSGIKQQQGAQIQFGTTRGSGTSKPPQTPPPTGGMGGR